MPQSLHPGWRVAFDRVDHLVLSILDEMAELNVLVFKRLIPSQDYIVHL